MSKTKQFFIEEYIPFKLKQAKLLVVLVILVLVLTIIATAKGINTIKMLEAENYEQYVYVKSLEQTIEKYEIESRK